MQPLPPPIPTLEEPGVIRWFHVYRHVLMAFLIIVGLGACVQTMDDKQPELRLMDLAISADDPALRDAMIREKERDMRIAMWVVAIAVPFLAAGRFVLDGTWAYRYGIATIILGALLCIGLPAAVILLIFWLRPEVGAYFAAQEAWRHRHSVAPAPPRGA